MHTISLSTFCINLKINSYSFGFNLMDSEEQVFDTVKFEKMKAMIKYNRFRKIKLIFYFFELLLALTLISLSSTYLPHVFNLAGSFLFKLTDSVFKPHVVFIIGNVIVVALIVLCRENDDAGDNDFSGSGDLYDDYIRQSQVKYQRKDVSVIEVDKKNENSSTSPVTEKMSGAVENRQILCVVPVVEKLKDREEEKKGKESIADVEPAKDGPMKEEIQKFQFQRTQSARRESAGVSGLELRRSETCRRGALTSSFEAVDRLSNDEFNLAVAAFIKRHQEEFLLQQNLAEDEGL